MARRCRAGRSERLPIMADDNVVNLGEVTGHGTMRTPEEMLLEVLEDTRNGAFKGYRKMLVLTLDEEDERFKVYWCQAGMKMSQCLTLCEVAKTIFLTEMNYIAEGGL